MLDIENITIFQINSRCHENKLFTYSKQKCDDWYEITSSLMSKVNRSFKILNNSYKLWVKLYELKQNTHRKNSFAEIFKNLARYRCENFCYRLSK